MLIPLGVSRRHAQERLRRSEERFSALVDSLADHAVCILDGSGKISSWTGAAERMYGYPADAILGHPHSILYARADAERGKPAHDLDAASSRGRFEQEGWQQRRDGSAFWARTVIAPLGSGTHGEFCMVAQDLTERRGADERVREGEARLREEVQRLKGELAERASQIVAANRELESFTYTVSHDLRGPLRHINSFAKLIIEESGDKVTPEMGRHLGIISRSAVKLGRLIDDLLHFSRMNRLDLRKEFVDLNRVVAEARREFEDELGSRRIEWKIGELPTVHADGPLMRVVFTQLISNAVKFTRHRDPGVIEIDARPGEKDEVILRVKDNGAGFDPLFKHKLFGIFQRLHHESEFEGVGIGLATVKRVIERHGGRVWAEGALDAGVGIYVALNKTV